MGWGLTPCGNLTTGAEGIGLDSTFLVDMGKLKGTLSKVAGVLYAVGEQIAFAQLDDPISLVPHVPPRGGLRHGLLQQRQGLSNPPGQRIGRAQVRGDNRGKERNVRDLAALPGSFKHRERLWEVPFVVLFEPLDNPCV